LHFVAPLKLTDILAISAVAIFLFSTLIWSLAWWLRKWRGDKFSKQWVSSFKEHSRFEKVDGVNLHYVVFGEGPDILLLHGIAANIFCWRHLIPFLSAHFRVWAVDLKGFGQSDAPLESDYGLLAQAELLLNFLVQKNLSQVTLIGNSMGGAIAAEMAIQKPDLTKGLVLINPAYDPKLIKIDIRRFKFFVPLIAPFVNRFLVRLYIKRIYGSSETKISEEVVDGYIAPYLGKINNYLTFLKAFDALMDHSLISRIEKIKLPILIVGGQNDNLVPIRYTEALHKRLLTSQLIVHPTAGHHIQEENPLWLAEQIKQFIS